MAGILKGSVYWAGLNPVTGSESAVESLNQPRTMLNTPRHDDEQIAFVTT